MARKRITARKSKARRTPKAARATAAPRPLRVTKLTPPASAWRRGLRAFQKAPIGAQVVVALLAAVTFSLMINWIYQVIRKPSELFFPVSGTLYKTPTETWEEYGPIFRQHATKTITPEFLAALAQVEGSGNPIVRTYWRFSWKPQPFEVYRPASSAVGMYQITDSTFEESKRYCIHDHVVAEVGPWNDWHSCWFNSLYMRVVPSHAVEMTSAYLDTRVAAILARHRIRSATVKQKQDLATVIHLCGAGAGSAFARRGLRPLQGQRCGDHNVRAYLARVSSLKMVFARLARKTAAQE